MLHTLNYKLTVKVKWSRYRTGVAQRVGRGIALLFHDRGARKGWVVSNTPRPHFTPRKDHVPILHETEWTPGPIWTTGKSRSHRDSIPDRPARSQSIYRLSYPAHSKLNSGSFFSFLTLSTQITYTSSCVCMYVYIYIYIYICVCVCVCVCVYTVGMYSL